MNMRQKLLALRVARKQRVRANMQGTATKPRVSVARSNRYIFMQAIDDVAGKTIFGLRDTTGKETKMERATATAKKFAARLQKENITQVIFDRGPYKYHGRIRAIADALRESGINV